MDGGFVLVLGLCGAILSGEEDGEPYVEDEADEEADAGDPDSGAVEDFVKELGVVIKGLGSGKDEEVSGEVTSEEEGEDESGDCDDEFSSDGGAHHGAEGAGG